MSSSRVGAGEFSTRAQDSSVLDPADLPKPKKDKVPVPLEAQFYATKLHVASIKSELLRAFPPSRAASLRADLANSPKYQALVAEVNRLTRLECPAEADRLAQLPTKGAVFTTEVIDELKDLRDEVDHEIEAIYDHHLARDPMSEAEKIAVRLKKRKSEESPVESEEPIKSPFIFDMKKMSIFFRSIIMKKSVSMWMGFRSQEFALMVK